MVWWLVWGALATASPLALQVARVVGGPGCGADAQEPNDARSRARPLAAAVEVAGAACAGDEDWFAVRLARGEVLELALRHHPTARFRPPEVYGPRSRRPRGQAQQRAGAQVVRWRARRDGVHRIRVRSPEAVRAAYTLHARITPAPGPRRAGPAPRASARAGPPR